MDHHMHHPPQDHGVHGMLLFGEETIFLSHLPMFMSIHDRQVLLEVTLDGSQEDAQAVYRADRQKSGARVYTLVPEPFSLQRIGAEGADALRTFQATIHRGHFEKPGHKVILDPVTVNVVNVIHFRQFDPNAQPLRELQYLLFGRGSELYIAHWITQPPDFDQIVSVASAGQDFSDATLRRGVRLAFPGRANTIIQRLRSGERAAAQLDVTSGDVTSEALTIETAAELYLEEGELAEKPTFASTDEEIAAGFL